MLDSPTAISSHVRYQWIAIIGALVGTAVASTVVTSTSARTERADPYSSAHITQLDATHYAIDAVLLDTLLAAPMKQSGGAHLVPSTHGIKLYGIRPDSIFDRIGFANGDTVITVNGYALDSAEAFFSHYAEVRNATDLHVVFARRGEPRTMHLAIR